MARATLEDISKLLPTDRSGWAVCYTNEAGEGQTLTVYTGDDLDPYADVFLVGNTAELWAEGINLKTIRSIQDAKKVADEITAYLDKEKAAMDEYRAS